MTYPSTIKYLFSRLPMFHRIGSAAYKGNLDNVTALCNSLGNPQKDMKFVHVAGTNGKGSVCHILASIFQVSGYKTGLFTSPHLKDFRERIKINGKPIPEKTVVDFVKKNKAYFEKINLSFFEMTVGLAFEYFRKEKTEIAIIETGMGGRLDSTNILVPALSVITNISFDHTDILGNTLQEIASEKAGIIKDGIPVVIGESHPGTERVFTESASRKNALLYFADRIIRNTGYTSDLSGAYQKKNIRTALQCIEALQKAGLKIPDGAVSSGLKNVIKNTGLMGRWHVISKWPLGVCDVAHNVAGIEEVMAQAKATPHRNLHVVFGCVKDKDYNSVLNLLPRTARYYFCKANIPRGLDAKILASEAQKFGIAGKPYSSVKKAFNRAVKNAGKNDMVLVTGSTFVVAEVL